MVPVATVALWGECGFLLHREIECGTCPFTFTWLRRSGSCCYLPLGGSAGEVGVSLESVGKAGLPLGVAWVGCFRWALLG